MQCVTIAGFFHGRDGKASNGVDESRGRACMTNSASAVREEGLKS